MVHIPTRARVFLAGLATLALAGCPCNLVLPAGIVPIDGGPDLRVTGAYGLEGELIAPEGDTPWIFDAQSTFRTGGFSVGAPEVVVLESFPEQVIIRLPVAVPPPGSAVTQVITEVPVTASIDVSADAIFDVVIQQTCADTAP